MQKRIRFLIRFSNKIFKNYSWEFERVKIENQIFVKVDNFQETTIISFFFQIYLYSEMKDAHVSYI